MNKKSYIQPTIEVRATMAALSLLGTSLPWEEEIKPAGDEITQY